MSLIEIILVGIGLSMDAVAVSMSNGMVYRALPKRKWLLAPLFFGIFQGLMPLLGFFTGALFAKYIDCYAELLILLILGFIGGKMIYDGFKGGKDDTEEKALSTKLIFFQAVATSIDAFAVGIGFCAMNVNIYFASSLIAAVTFILSLFAFCVGRKFGDLLGNKAEIFGGTILVILAIKAII